MLKSIILYLTTPPDLYTLKEKIKKKKAFNGLPDTVKPSHGNVGLSTALSQAPPQELMAAAKQTSLEERDVVDRCVLRTPPHCSSARIKFNVRVSRNEIFF